MNTLLRLFSYWFVLAAVSAALAQTPVTTQPYTGAITSNASSTVGTTSAFQPLFAAVAQIATPATPQANQRRSACTVQNNSASNPMYVFWGPIANATLLNSVKLAPGQSANCNVGGITLQDQVSITGTSGDAFYAAQQ